MEERGEALSISRQDYQKGEFNIDSQTIKVKNINFTNTEENTTQNEKNKIWGSISNRFFESQINESIKDCKTRTNLIDEIVNNVVQNNINGVIVDFNKIEEKDLQRFLIELTPRLREIGVKTTVVINDNMKKDDYKNIVDYIVE